jgi:hypothetical protein
MQRLANGNLREGLFMVSRLVGTVVPEVIDGKVERFCLVYLVKVGSGDNDPCLLALVQHRRTYRHQLNAAKFYGSCNDVLHAVMEFHNVLASWCDICFYYHQSSDSLHLSGKSHAKMVKWLAMGGEHKLMKLAQYSAAHDEPADWEFARALRRREFRGLYRMFYNMRVAREVWVTEFQRLMMETATTLGVQPVAREVLAEFDIDGEDDDEDLPPTTLGVQPVARGVLAEFDINEEDDDEDLPPLEYD